MVLHACVQDWGKKILWIYKPKINLCHSDCNRNLWKRKAYHIICQTWQRHTYMVMSCLAASGSSIIDDVKTDRSSRINSVQMGHPGILQKQPKSFSRQRNGMLLNGQVVLPIPAKWSMTCSYWRQNWMQRPTEDGCSKDLAEHLKAMSVAKDFYSQY